MAYPASYIAMVVGAVRTLVGAENMHLRDAIARVARQMNLDAGAGRFVGEAEPRIYGT